jgi:hypothetical protein
MCGFSSNCSSSIFSSLKRLVPHWKRWPRSSTEKKCATPSLRLLLVSQTARWWMRGFMVRRGPGLLLPNGASRQVLYVYNYNFAKVSRTKEIRIHDHQLRLLLKQARPDASHGINNHLHLHLAHLLLQTSSNLRPEIVHNSFCPSSKSRPPSVNRIASLKARLHASKVPSLQSFHAPFQI